MSEEIQGHNDRQVIASDTHTEEDAQQAAQTSHSTESSSSPFRPPPRAGALLVEAYGKLVGKQPKVVSPDKVLFEYAKFLVSFRILVLRFFFLVLV